MSAFAASSAPASSQEDFLAVPEGSTLVLPSGDSVKVDRAGYLVSSGAVDRMDLAIREARQDLEICRANDADRQEQLAVLEDLVDSMTVSLAVERAWRSVGVEILRSQQQSGFSEVLENFGLAAGGFILGNLTARPLTTN